MESDDVVEAVKNPCPTGPRKTFSQSSFPEIYRYHRRRERSGACSFGVPPLHQPRISL